MHDWEWLQIREDYTDIEHLSAEEIDAEVDRRDARSRALLISIFEKYCEAGAMAFRVNDGMHWGGEMPDYDPATEVILSTVDKGDRFIVETQMAHNYKFRFRYELVMVNGKWLIRDDRKRKADFDNSWNHWIL